MLYIKYIVSLINLFTQIGGIIKVRHFAYTHWVAFPSVVGGAVVLFFEVVNFVVVVVVV